VIVYRSSAELTFDHGEMICFLNSITVLFFLPASIQNQIFFFHVTEKRMPVTGIKFATKQKIIKKEFRFAQFSFGCIKFEFFHFRSL